MRLQWLPPRQHVGRAEDDVAAHVQPGAGGPAIDRELGHAAPQVPVAPAHFRGLVIVGQGGHAQGVGRARQPLHHRPHLRLPRRGPLQQEQEVLEGHAGPVGVGAELLRRRQALGEMGQMVVEGQQPDPALHQPGPHVGGAVHVVGFVAQVHPGVAQQPGAQPLQRVQHLDHRVAPPQARLPRVGDAVEGGGDAVGHHLAVGVQQAHVHRQPDSRPRHDLALEGVAVQVDDAGQDQAAVRIPGGVRLPRRRFAEGGDVAAVHGDGAGPDRSVGLQGSATRQNGAHEHGPCRVHGRCIATIVCQKDPRTTGKLLL